jgi:hypothetical protein
MEYSVLVVILDTGTSSGRVSFCFPLLPPSGLRIVTATIPPTSNRSNNQSGHCQNIASDGSTMWDGINGDSSRKEIHFPSLLSAMAKALGTEFYRPEELTPYHRLVAHPAGRKGSFWNSWPLSIEVQ